MKFTVNAAGCGKGKSTDNKAFVTTNENTRFLIIVPSLALAAEYKEFGTTITSATTNNVKKQIHRAIDANTRVIVITQKAFLDFEAKELLCTHRTVLQDEHLEPFSVCKWVMGNHMHWIDMFKVAATDKAGWHEVQLDTQRAQQFQESCDMLDNRLFMQDLLATPQRIFTNKPALHADSMLFRVVSPAIYKGADAVRIACANFTCTRQYLLWTALFEQRFQMNLTFEPYDTPNLTLHVAQQKRNSKTHNKANASVRDGVVAYINSKCNDPVYIDNNVYDDESGWCRVNHNCHGVNEHRDKAHIAILSAVNYDNLATAFLSDMAGMTTEQVRHSLMGDIAHQVIMRGALRSGNDKECHVYLMESDLASYLASSVFVNSQLTVIDDTARPDRGPALTPVQRKKATLIRKNFAQYKEMPTEELMQQPIWGNTNTNGVFSKNYLANSPTEMCIGKKSNK
jgi:hypothetical protein